MDSAFLALRARFRVYITRVNQKGERAGGRPTGRPERGSATTTRVGENMATRSATQAEAHRRERNDSSSFISPIGLMRAYEAAACPYDRGQIPQKCGHLTASGRFCGPETTLSHRRSAHPALCGPARPTGRALRVKGSFGHCLGSQLNARQRAQERHPRFAP